MSNKKIIKSVASGGPTRRATSITQSDPIVKAKPTIAPGASWISYTTIALFVAISYIFLVPWYADYVNHVLPHNDPFTYTLNWFQVIDDYRSGDYLRTLASYLFYPDNWDRLMDLERRRARSIPHQGTLLHLHRQLCPVRSCDGYILPVGLAADLLDIRIACRCVGALAVAGNLRV